MTKLAVLLVLLPLVARAAPLAAAPAPAKPADGEERREVAGDDEPRRRWYLGAGLGYGDGTLDVFGERTSLRQHIGKDPTRLALTAGGGVAVRPRIRIGLDVTWLRAAAVEDGVTAGVRLLGIGPVATLFPIEGRGLFVRAGGGFSRITLEVERAEFRDRNREDGAHVVGGVGYTFPVYRRLGVTLRLDAAKQWFDEPRIGLDGSTSWAGYVGADWF